MALRSRIPTHRYFITMFVIVSALFFTFSTVIYRNYYEAQRINAWSLYNYEVLRQCHKILMDLIDMETGVRGYVLTGKQSFLAPYEEAKRTLYSEISVLDAYTAKDPAARASLNNWLKQITSHSETLNDQIAMTRAKGSRAVTQTSMTKQKVQMDRLRISLESFLQERLAKLHAQVAQSQAAHTNFKSGLCS